MNDAGVQFPYVACSYCHARLSASDVHASYRLLSELAELLGVEDRGKWIAARNSLCPQCIEEQRIWTRT